MVDLETVEVYQNEPKVHAYFKAFKCQYNYKSGDDEVRWLI